MIIIRNFAILSKNLDNSSPKLVTDIYIDIIDILKINVNIYVKMKNFSINYYC